jgi:hypothetical protein
METNRIVGFLLIVVGSAALLAATTPLGGEIVVVSLGLAFLGCYVVTRAYGLLVPGAILTGLGTGTLVAAAGGPQEAVTLGLGLGFLAIAGLDVLLREPSGAWWWPLIPGGVLTVVGTSTMTGVQDVGRYVVPLLLVALGIRLLVRRDTTSDTGRDSASDEPWDTAGSHVDEEQHTAPREPAPPRG